MERTDQDIIAGYRKQGALPSPDIYTEEFVYSLGLDPAIEDTFLTIESATMQQVEDVFAAQLIKVEHFLAANPTMSKEELMAGTQALLNKEQMKNTLGSTVNEAQLTAIYDVMEAGNTKIFNEQKVAAEQAASQQQAANEVQTPASSAEPSAASASIVAGIPDRNMKNVEIFLGKQEAKLAEFKKNNQDPSAIEQKRSELFSQATLKTALVDQYKVVTAEQFQAVYDIKINGNAQQSEQQMANQSSNHQAPVQTAELQHSAEQQHLPRITLSGSQAQKLGVSASDMVLHNSISDEGLNALKNITFSAVAGRKAISEKYRGMDAADGVIDDLVTFDDGTQLQASGLAQYEIENPDKPLTKDKLTQAILSTGTLNADQLAATKRVTEKMNSYQGNLVEVLNENDPQAPQQYQTAQTHPLQNVAQHGGGTQKVR